MKKSHHLFELIQSMTKNEKRYFKISAGKHVIGDENNYVRLFDFVAKQQKADDDEIKHHFKQENFVKRLSAAKYDLYHLVLRSLNEYHSKATIKSELRDGLDSIELLMRKALYDQASKTLNATRKLAESHEEFSFISELCEVEIKLLQRQGRLVSDRTRLEELLSEGTIAREFAEKLVQLKSNQLQINSLFHKIGSPRSKEEENQYLTFFKLEDFKGSDSWPTSLKMALFHLMSTWYFVHKDFVKASKYAFDRADLMRDNLDLLADSNDYLSAIYNAELLANRVYDFEKAQEYRGLMESFTKKIGKWPITENNRVLLFKSKNNALMFFIETAQLEKAREVEQEVEDRFKYFQKYLGSIDQVVLLYNLVNLNIYLDDYKKASYWMSKLLNHPSISEKEDLFAFARILKLIIHLELRNFDVLPYYVRSTHRFFSKRDRGLATEQIVLNFVKKQAKKKLGEKDQISVDDYLELETQLKKLWKDSTSEKIILDYFNIDIWLKSKIIKEPFIEAYKTSFPDRCK